MAKYEIKVKETSYLLCTYVVEAESITKAIEAFTSASVIESEEERNELKNEPVQMEDEIIDVRKLSQK